MRIGFGCVKLGSVTGSQGWRSDARLVREALDRGVTLFDTADTYAHGASEVVLGRGLQGRRDEATIATKGGYVFVERSYLQYASRRAARRVLHRWRAQRPDAPLSAPGGAYGHQDFSPAYLRRALDASLRRLRTDRVDVYQLHGPPDVLPDLIAQLQDLVAAGKVLRFGVGAESVTSAERWSGVAGVDVVQLPFGILDPEATTAIPTVRARGVDAWARGVFGGGVFGGPAAAAPHQRDRLAGLDDIARRAGVDRYRLAFEYVRRCGGVSAVILGMSSREHLARNVALAAAPPIEPSTLHAVDELVAATTPSVDEDGAAPAGAPTARPPARHTSGPPPRVTVFDLDMPPAVAFVRSLARAGVPVAARVASPFVAGRFSRYVDDPVVCPGTERSDELIAFIADELQRGTTELIAPTSDGLVFAAATACGLVGLEPEAAGLPSLEALTSVLFKDRFGRATADAGFPAPRTSAPLSADDARRAAAELGYPIVIKPRAHLAIGNHRGIVVRDDRELTRAFRPYRFKHASTFARQTDPDLAWPILQHYHDPDRTEIVSVSGCLDHDGTPLALTHCRKRSQAPRRLGIGTMFEVLPAQPFTERAVEAARQILGAGLFELEVMVDRATGETWSLDLNARAFGQIALDIALGADLPILWYRSLTGHSVRPAAARRTRPDVWHEATFTYVGLLTRFVTGPDRREIVGHAVHTLRQPRVEAMADVQDPLPGLLHGLRPLRHPRALLRHVAGETEFVDATRLPVPSALPPDS